MHLRPDTLCNLNRYSRLVLLCACLGLVASCSSGRSWQQPEQSYAYTPAASYHHHPAVNIALDMVGRPYRYGAEGPDSFDCSGLVWYSYRRAGHSVPRTSVDQFRTAKPVALSAAQPGDLLFFGSRRNISHVAIYMGDRTFVHAPSSGKSVSVANLGNSWYREHFVSAGRLPGL